MNVPSTLTPLPVALPLLGAALMASLRKWLTRAMADSLAISLAAGTLVIGLLLLATVLHGPSVYWFGNWYPRGTIILGISFVAEPISAGLCVLAASLALLSLVFSWRLVDSGSNHLQPLLLIFLAAMCGFSLTVDIFNLFVFFELMSTAAFALCGLKTEEPAPLQGSFNFAVTNTIGAFLILTGISLLYAVTGALNMAQIGLSVGARHDPLVLFAFTLLACGFFIKAAIVPFHLWLPDAHAVAPTPVCVLFSGLMVQLGLFAVARLRFVIFAQTFSHHEASLRAIFLSLGSLTVIVGGLMCYAEHHLKRMLAFSTIAHSGVMLAAIGLGGPFAFTAMLLYLIGHAFTKGGLFFTTGILLHRLRGIGERSLFAKGRNMPWTALLWFLGAAGLAGAPPFLLMAGEGGIHHAADLVGLSWMTWIFELGGLFTSAAVLRAGMHTFFGWGTEPVTDEAAEVGELPETVTEERRTFVYQYAPAAICTVAPMVLLVTSSLWLRPLSLASTAFAQQATMLHLVYTGAMPAETAPLELQSVWHSAGQGLFTLLLAAALASTSVFRTNLRRRLRIGGFLESNLSLLRAIQSGHPGDYVLWITIGVASIGSVMLISLR